ncbi:MAG: RNA methyltransferase [Caldilineaceae bacterium]|nr:RNA methyltransferase [Caldilineaceae bacterium]
MLEITSANNPRLKMARKLQRRRAREQSGLCLLEGARLVADAWRAGVTLESVFIARSFAAGLEQTELLAALALGGTPLYLVEEALLAGISDTVTPQGIVAVAPIPPAIPEIASGLVLVLDGIADPGNAGTLLRSAVGAGAGLVIFGPEAVDAYSPKVLRAGVGAHFRIAIATCSAWAEVETLLGNERQLFVADARGALGYDGVDWSLPSALIIGNEAHGPSQAAASAAIPIAIPMQGGVESLNAAVAGSVILFEAARQRLLIGAGDGTALEVCDPSRD